MNEELASSRRRRRMMLLTILLATGLMGALNGIYRYEWILIDEINLLPINEPNAGFLVVGIEGQAPPAIGGWPFHYVVGVPHGDDQWTYRWNWMAAIYNALIALGIIALAWLWSRNRFPAAAVSEGGSAKRKGSQLSLSDVLVLVLLIALPLGYWQQQRSQAAAHREQAQELSRYGEVKIEAIVPQVLVSRLPRFVIESWGRITQVVLENAPSKLVEPVLESGHLRRLRLGGTGYELASLQRLPSMPLLSELQIGGRALDGTTIAAIGMCEQLHDLSLARTNISSTGLEHLNRLVYLQSLDLRDTAIRLEDVGSLPSPNTMQRMALPRPAPGGTDSVTLENWPKLSYLSVSSVDQLPNDAEFALRIDNLPRLRLLYLDELQKFSLEINDCPGLEILKPIVFSRNNRLLPGMGAPGGFWLTKLHLSGIPVLPELNVYGCDLVDCKITIPQSDVGFVLGIAVFDQLANGRIRYRNDLPLELRQNWLATLGQPQGANKLDLASIPLNDVDFSALAGNDQLTALDLRETRLDGSTLPQLKEVKSLRFLDVSANEIGYQKINEALQALTQVEVLKASATTLQRLRIEHHPKLRELQLDEYRFPLIDALRLVDLPEFETALTTSPQLQYLHVERLPKLKGLGITGPFPKRALVSDLAGLKWFCAGGSELKSEIVQEILKSRQLEHLQLAFPDIQREDLDGISQLSELRVLSLPGCPVDSAFLETLSSLTKLVELDLSDTAIGDEGIDKLIACKQLEKIKLRNTNVSAAGASKLGALPSLKEIELSGLGLSTELFQAIAQCRQLERLVLRDASVVDDTALAMLTSARLENLRFIDFRGTEVDRGSVLGLARSFPSLKFSLSPELATGDLIEQLARTDQLEIIEEEYSGFFFKMPRRGELVQEPTEFTPPVLPLDYFRAAAQQNGGRP